MTTATVSSRRRTGLLVVGTVGSLQLLAVALQAGTPLQPLLSVVFVLTCPGLLLLDLDQPADFSARLIIGIGGSLAVNTAIATVVLVADGRWVAPVLALALVGVAALPRERLQAFADRLSALLWPSDDGSSGES